MIKKYKLKNDYLEVTILNIGASIYELKYKNVNCVLSYSDINDYIENPLQLGALVGRVAGRISGGMFILNNHVYKLDKNDGVNSIHGGYNGLTNKLWEITDYDKTNDKPYIELTTDLKDGESGYPGNLKVKAKYTLNYNKVELQISAKSDQDTIVNITNHSYFNLNLKKTDKILNHELSIDANRYISLDSLSIPKSIKDVEATNFDFRSSKKLLNLDFNDDEELMFFGGYDHPFILNNNCDSVELYSEDSGIKMTLSTSYPSVVLYTGNKIGKEQRLNEGCQSFNQQGICIEAQYEPDYINQKYLPNYILREGEKYSNEIIWEFN